MPAKYSKVPYRGRGAGFNPNNKFNSLNRAEADNSCIEDSSKSDTQYFKDNPKSIINQVSSPDLGMYYSVNPYQGCEHGCVYCYARNTHEYWGWSAGLDFETKVVMKPNAPDLLKKNFNDPKYVPYPVAIAGNTDAYQPIERKMGITRQLLQVCLEYKHPVSLITKNSLILRDEDLLRELAAKNLVKVHFTVTTLDEDLRRAMEPRTAPAGKRLSAIQKLSGSEIPVDLLLAPVIPGLNDHEMPAILQAASNHGARSASYTLVRLNGAISEVFKEWLKAYFPDKANKVWHQIQSCHGGQVNDSRWGKRLKGEGQIAEMIKNLFNLHVKQNFKDKPNFAFNFNAFCGAGAYQQKDLFDQ